jgi:cytochrome c oxidase subunit II
MAEEETTREGARTKSPEEVRPKGQASIAQMIIIGAIASALGIALGLIINWFPTPASTQAEKIDTLYDVLIIVSVPVFVLVTVVVLFSVWKFRMRPGEELADGPPIHGNTRLEVIWTAIPAIVLVALCTYAYVTLTDLEEAKAGEQRINVYGQQFAWTFEYPQGAGKKPVLSNQLYLKENQPVRFFVKAKDVIHDFWVPAFRMKIDAVPGITTDYRVTPNRIGNYPVVCAELCGLGHSVMRSTAHVVSADRYDARRRRRARRQDALHQGQRHLDRLRRLPHPGRRGHEREHRPRSRQGPQGARRQLHQAVDPGARRPGDTGLQQGHHAQGLRTDVVGGGAGRTRVLPAEGNGRMMDGGEG